MDCKTAQSLVMPYINGKLTDEQTEDFLRHIFACRECYEELEIFFTVYVALQKLDTGGSTTFNMKELLWENLKAAEKRIIHRKLIHYFSYAVMLAAECLLVLMLITGREDSGLFADIHGETEMVSESETESEDSEDTEQEGKESESTEAGSSEAAEGSRE